MAKAKAHIQVDIHQWTGPEGNDARQDIATETAISLVYNGISYAVMMATPDDFEDFGMGFSLSEGIIESPAEMKSYQVFSEEKGLVLAMDIPEERFAAIADRKRHLAGRTGCGLCGVESLDEAVRDLPRIETDIRLSFDGIYKAYEALSALQPGKQTTGAMHGAAFVTPDGEIKLVREDVGRHNALDKLIGAAVRGDIDPASGFVFLTSRCSFEMVQKTVAWGCPMLAAISAPTSLAVELAEKANLTLVALARKERFIGFTHVERIVS